VNISVLTGRRVMESRLPASSGPDAAHYGEEKRIVHAKEREAGEDDAYLPPGEGSRSL
jgi:hypothetical protein